MIAMRSSFLPLNEDIVCYYHRLFIRRSCITNLLLFCIACFSTSFVITREFCVFIYFGGGGGLWLLLSFTLELGRGGGGTYAYMDGWARTK